MRIPKVVFLSSGLILASVALVILVYSRLLSFPVNIKPEEGRVFSPPLQLPPFHLIDHTEKPFTNAQLKGHWTLAMIGFTFCPDVCPLILGKMADMYAELDQAGEKTDRPTFVFFSVDTFRDTPETLSGYVPYFRPEFIGVTGDPEEINRLVKAIGLYYAYTDPHNKTIIHDVLHRPSLEKYAVIHSTELLVLNPKGEIVAMLHQPFEASRILKNYKALRRRY